MITQTEDEGERIHCLRTVFIAADFTVISWVVVVDTNKTVIDYEPFQIFYNYLRSIIVTGKLHKHPQNPFQFSKIDAKVPILALQI